jgi:hypothetical protein
MPLLPGFDAPGVSKLTADRRIAVHRVPFLPRFDAPGVSAVGGPPVHHSSSRGYLGGAGPADGARCYPHLDTS